MSNGGDENIKVWPSWYIFIVIHKINTDWRLLPQFWSNNGKDNEDGYYHTRVGVQFLFFTLGFNNQKLIKKTTVGFK